MKCAKCGAALADGDLFCNECGARVEAGASPVAVFCEQCGAKNNAHDRFCKACGVPLTAEAHTHESKPTPRPGSEQAPHAVPAAAPKSSKPIILAIVGAIAAVLVIAVVAPLILRVAGSATATQTATKIINDMRAAKSAGLLIYMDNGQSWSWATQNNANRMAITFDKYMDRPLFSGSDAHYSLLFAENVEIKSAEGRGSIRTLIGFLVEDAILTEGVKKKLRENASRAGLYNADGSLYDGRGQTVYMTL